MFTRSERARVSAVHGMIQVIFRPLQYGRILEVCRGRDPIWNIAIPDSTGTVAVEAAKAYVEAANALSLEPVRARNQVLHAQCTNCEGLGRYRTVRMTR